MNPTILYGIAAALVFGLLLAVVATAIRFLSGRKLNVAEAKQRFEKQQRDLEKSFLSHAGESSPRGLAITTCEFESQPLFARDTTNGSLRAFVAVTIGFEAIAGGGMEDNPNVANLRAATAVFHYVRGEWFADGQVLYNLEPQDAIERFSHELQAIDPSDDSDSTS